MFSNPQTPYFESHVKHVKEVFRLTKLLGLRSRVPPEQFNDYLQGQEKNVKNLDQALKSRRDQYEVDGNRFRKEDVLQKANLRLGLEFLGPLMFRTRAKEPFIWTLPETVALAKEIGPNIGATLDAWHWHHSGGTVADILATDRSRIVHIHVSDAKPQPPEEVRDNQRHMPGEGVIDLVGFFQALKKIGYQDAVSPEPLGRVPEGMTPEDGARLGLDTTLAVMKRAGVA